MPKVNSERDDTMAQAGYLRAAIIAVLFGVRTSTVIRWPIESKKIGNIKSNGLNWLTWADVRASRKEEADIRKLAMNAYDALLDARSRTE